MQRKGNSLLETKRKNRILIKNSIFHSSKATRTAIANELSLTLPTITTSINELLEEGILEEKYIADEDLTNSMGRRPTAIVFRDKAACIIGVELGPYSTIAVLMDIGGNILSRVVEEKANENYEKMLEKLEKQVEVLKEKAGNIKLLGVSIGLPGFIDGENGIIRNNLRKAWVGKKLAKDLEQLVNLKVIIDNNVRLRAVGYEMQLKDIYPEAFAYLFISKGVACPIMLRDEGMSSYSAGELGQMVVCIDEIGSCKTLDDLGSETAIFEACQENLLKGKLIRLKAILEDKGSFDIDDILTLQEEKEEEILSIIDKALKYLGLSLANVINLINPGFVVVDAYIMSCIDNRKKLLEYIKQHLYGLYEGELAIKFVDFDESLGAKGAAYYGIKRLFIEV